MVSKFRARQRRASGAAVALAVALVAAFPAIASAGCPAAPLSQPFSQFGDNSWYQLAPGGSFEASTAGWVGQSGLLGLAQSGVTVGDGNDAYNLMPGTHSLTVGPNGYAVSPPVCISSEYPTWRFVAHQLGGASSSPLNVSLRWVNVLGVGVETGAGSLSGYSRWTPSPVMKLANSVPLWMPGSTLMVQLVFRAGAGSTYSIDDVYLDPYRR
jgi:hypothetical protein